MTPEDGKTLAEAVAKTLGARLFDFSTVEDDCDLPLGDVIAADGSNLFSDHWFKRCLLELLKRGYSVDFDGELGPHVCEPWPYGTEEPFRSDCPPEEFPARAIAALMKDRP